MSHVLRYAARTDRGLLRANNQDSVFAGDRLLVIADGMGGHAAGDVASRLVVAAFVDLDELPLGSDMVRPLTDATREGNSAIAEMVDENPELDGMGTTLTALLFDGPVVALAHVGDSRAYLYRNGVLHQISHDDTFVQSLVDDGRITADEAAHHPQRSLLLRALNGTEMDPSITMRETSAGDRFLICSDGLSDVVSPEAIADALAGPGPGFGGGHADPVGSGRRWARQRDGDRRRRRRDRVAGRLRHLSGRDRSRGHRSDAAHPSDPGDAERAAAADSGGCGGQAGVRRRPRRGRTRTTTTHDDEYDPDDQYAAGSADRVQRRRRRGQGRTTDGLGATAPQLASAVGVRTGRAGPHRGGRERFAAVGGQQVLRRGQQ